MTRRAGRRPPRIRARTRVLIIAISALLAGASLAAVADALLRSRIESELSATSTPVELALGSQPVLWGYLTGTLHLDAHLDAAQMQQAISAKAGIAVGDITLSDGAILASIDTGPLSALLGGDVLIELTPEAVDGKLSISVSGISVGGEEREGTALAAQLGPVTIDPAEMMNCAALADVEADNVSVEDGDMVVSLSVPTAAAKDFNGCR
ncbi:hypothetical protein BJQ94_11275 [Cryobacterium sp. SO2]|uniref:hypothetical protein n=1 Tax=Cryobacterium sp. SO2 TaxID=1897060 RepID=UPI00223E7C5F|nr:hypothetical protein [Cryobacterium sp. SO2]WEO75957.1 hypothetical protein BJQ94_11275 [Cryobacterium sp. SO2]